MKLHSAVLIALIIVFSFASVSAQSGNATLDFSDFLMGVNRGQVTDVTVEGSNITGHFTDGRAFTTYSPNDPSLVNRLVEKGVRVTDAAAARLADAAAVRAACESRFGIEQWVQNTDLTANPFRFKGKIVGVRTFFKKMIAEDEAVFGSADMFTARFDGEDVLVVSKVPASAFTRSGQHAALALSVAGMRIMNGINIPYLKLAAVVDCP